MSQGDGDMHGPWNSGSQWEAIADRNRQVAVDGGSGVPSVGLSALEQSAVQALAARTLSQPDSDPTTGADLGAGPGAGSTKGSVAR
ncbi:hypothetical protein QE400_001278 [Xanthomonas sacchari]|nr:hypothetical protein [Xanthomonas sacchari]